MAQLRGGNMALNGPQALKSLDNAIADIRQEETRLAKLLARSTESTAKLNETKAGLIRQLAKVRLDKDARLELSDQLFGAQNKAHKVLEKHDASLKKVEKELKALDVKIAQNISLRQNLLAEIDKAQLELKSLSKKIAKEISANPQYTKIQEETFKLQEIAKQAQAKTELAQADQQEKGQPYKNDPLFIYLWDRKFGTKDYKSSNLFRWLDKKVAHLINYSDARANYAMLNEIPLRLSEHADYQNQLLHASQDRLNTLEQEAIDKAGGKPFRLAITKAQGKLNELDNKLLALEDERDEKANAYRLLAQGREPAFEEATQMLAQSLNRQDIQELMRMAQLTSSAEDDIIVKKIDDIKSRILDEIPISKQYKQRLKTLHTRRRELEDIEWEFKKSRFDDPRSSFKKNDLTGSLLTEFLSGAISAAVYWNQWQNSHSWQSGASDWGGGIGLPRSKNPARGANKPWSFPSSSKSGNSFSRPRSSSKRYSSSRSRPTRSRPSRSGSRGSRKSSGFKTGGEF